MILAAELVFWFCFLAVFHSYVLYPLILEWLADRQDVWKKPVAAGTASFQVRVLLSVFNEEQVIEQKIRSVMDTHYDLSKIRVLVGSDGSTDSSDEILMRLQKEFSNLHFYRFEGRRGKANVLNELFRLCNLPDQAEDYILIMTDANVLFSPSAIGEMVRHFEDEKMAVVGAHIINNIPQKKGISLQESKYIKRENKIKEREGKLWGATIGAFGACYAIRASYVEPIPSNFLMEDFYLTMKALSKGGKVIHEPKARCFEDIPDEVEQEFRRKTRISTGNFQNLEVFKSMLWPPWKPVGFAFLSHKALRWFGPFFILISYFCLIGLASQSPFYKALFLIETAFLLSPLADMMLQKAGFHFVTLRFVSYFIQMNLALLAGFFKYLKGVKTNVWQPTKRNQ